MDDRTTAQQSAASGHEFTATLHDTATDVSEAHRVASALMELLTGCQKDHTMHASLFLGLIQPLHLHLENAVDGVRQLTRSCVAEGDPTTAH